MNRVARNTALTLLILVCLVTLGCKSPQDYREQADRVAYDHIAAARAESLGHAEPFTIERPEDTLRRRLLRDQNLPRASAASLGARDIEPIKQWPNDNYLTRPSVGEPVNVETSDGAVTLTLFQALQVGAANSRDYQQQKESVFRAALTLDLEEDAFRNTWTGLLQSFLETDLSGANTTTGVRGSADGTFSRQLKNGATITSLIAIDLVKLLSGGRTQTFGINADASISIPLMRGSGRFVVTEPLTQAQRNVIYAIYEFERFKRTFAVRVATDYLGVLQQKDQLVNAENNYKRLISSTRRARRLADAGQLPEIQVDQARQNELSARNRWISTAEAYDNTLDRFRVSLGLPPDANVLLDADELSRLNQQAAALMQPLEQSESDQTPAADAPIVLMPPDKRDAGPFEFEQDRAIEIALTHRLDLRSNISRVFDAQRAIAIAADDLRADLTLLGSASTGGSRSIGSVTSGNAHVRPERGTYSALLSLNLPIERTSERNAYRNELIDLERAVRAAQQSEDEVKRDVRSNVRDLVESRESLRIQAEAVVVAQRRVESTDLFLQAGRAEIRDVLEAQESLISAQNALTSAVVRYRIAELAMQRDMGVLNVDDAGLWREYDATEDSQDGDA